MKAKRARTESINNQIYNCLIDNLLISLYILHDKYGFGEKRITDYINTHVEYAAKMDEYIRDEVIAEKTEDFRSKYRQQMNEILRTITKEFLPADFYTEIFEKPTPTRAEVVSRSNRQRKERAAKTAVSVTQAAEMQKAAQIFQQFLRERGDNNEIQTPAVQTLRRGDERNT